MPDLYCPRCAGVVTDSARFCHHCKLNLQTLAPAKAQVDRCRWERTSGEFAVRIPADQLGGLIVKSVDVDQSSYGMLFDGGGFRARLEPGAHVIKTLEDRLKTLFTGKSIDVILIDKGLFPVSVVSGGFSTAAGDDLRFQCDLAVQLSSRIQQFFENLMKQRGRITTADLLAHLQRPVEQCLLGIVRSCGIDELLNPHLELRQRFQDELQRELKPTAESLGLDITILASPLFFSSSRSEQVQERASMQNALRSEKLKQEFERQQLLLDRKWRAFERELASEDGQQALQDARDEHETREVLKTLEARAGANDLFRHEAAEKDWFEYKQRSNDRKRTRRWLLEDLERRRRTELARLEHDFRVMQLHNQSELSELERRQQIRIADEDLQRDQAQQQAQFQARLKQERELFDHDSKLKAETKAGARTDRLADNEADVTIEGKSFDEKARQAERDLELKKKKLDHALKIAQEQRLALTELQKSKQELAEQERTAAHQRQLEARRAEQSHELNRMNTIGTLSADALFAVVSPEQAGFLVKKLQNDLFRGMSVQQILAMKADDPVAAARALESAFAAADVPRSEQVSAVKDAYERLVSEIKSGHQESQQQLFALVDVIQKVAGTALATTRDVGVAAAGGKTEPDSMDLLKLLQASVQRATPAAPPAAAPVATPSEPSRTATPDSRIAACLDCRTGYPGNVRFCPVCGKPTVLQSNP